MLGVTLGIASWSQTQSLLGNITPMRGECNYCNKLCKGVKAREVLSSDDKPSKFMPNQILLPKVLLIKSRESLRQVLMA